VRDPVLAAEEDRLQVDVLHALPRLVAGREHGGVVVGGDAGVVEQHVDVPVLRAHLRIERADRVLVGDVARQREVAGGVRVEVDADHGRALAREEPRGGCTDAALGAGDHAHLAVEASHQPVPVA
jgi:hypothetical protein